MKTQAKAVFRGYANVFFMPEAGSGIVVLGVTLLCPEMALAGAVAVAASYGFARMIGMEKLFLESGHYTYNPLLVGLSLGYLFKITATAVFLIASAGVITFLATVFMAGIFLTYLRLPVMSLPFVAVSSIVYIASIQYASLPGLMYAARDSMACDVRLPFWLAGFFKAFGAVLFVPSILAGIALSVVVVRHSRILFFLALLGYYVGAAARTLMLGSAAQGFGDVNNFNFIFIAMALGGIFLIPSITSYLLAVISVATAAVLTDAITGLWHYYGIPAFTLPFNVVTLGAASALNAARHPLVPGTACNTPEETLRVASVSRLRFGGQKRTLHLPFAGRWTVWQAFDGQWTHKGSWRYAYDFVITDEHGLTHGGGGVRLEDYHCWKKPVLAPVPGRVAQVVDDLPDSPIGLANATDNWGNAVVIEDARGFFVEISHFASQSIRVKKGDWVEAGTVLGLCGNSGYSPQPHIHVQVQAAGTIGAPSLPFSFVSYIHDGEFKSNSLPGEQCAVEPLYRDKRLDSITNFMLDEEMRYAVLRNGRQVDTLPLTVKMATDGTFYFASPRGQLYFGKHEGAFYMYRVTGADPWLPLFFQALPRMPLAYREKLVWSDYLPANLASSGLRSRLADLFSSVFHRLAAVRVTQTFTNENRIESMIETNLACRRRTASAELDRHKGFASVTVENVTLKLEKNHA